jgi:hypothetical protein
MSLSELNVKVVRPTPIPMKASLSLSMGILVFLASASLAGGFNFGAASTTTQSAPLTMILGSRKFAARKRLIHGTSSIPFRQNDRKGRRTKLKRNNRKSSELQLGTSSSYLEYLDSLSGKKFRSYPSKPTTIADPLGNAMQSFLDGMLMKISSRAMV